MTYSVPQKNVGLSIIIQQEILIFIIFSINLFFVQILHHFLRSVNAAVASFFLCEIWNILPSDDVDVDQRGLDGRIYTSRRGGKGSKKGEMEKEENRLDEM